MASIWIVRGPMRMKAWEPGNWLACRCIAAPQMSQLAVKQSNAPGGGGGGGGRQQSDSQPCTLKTKSYLAQKPLHVAERDTGDERCLLFWTPPPSLCHTARVKSTESAAGAEV